ncbi:hypothetical protein E4U91_15340 [Streptomyces lasalocidi]|uniref:Uncharacterized protein n=1 Tax=Streptomyces lasalocidi TaxID=324833 RepID=A0A4U5WHB1_STRLS|nr:hypothetical protein E4U91_15340 [Streptomyces lasalocidi]
MPEALVEVTQRQPSCPARESRSVTLSAAVVLVMQKMATIVALVVVVPVRRVFFACRAAVCPPVRMV